MLLSPGYLPHLVGPAVGAATSSVDYENPCERLSAALSGGPPPPSGLVWLGADSLSWFIPHPTLTHEDRGLNVCDPFAYAHWPNEIHANIYITASDSNDITIEQYNPNGWDEYPVGRWVENLPCGLTRTHLGIGSDGAVEVFVKNYRWYPTNNPCWQEYEAAMGLLGDGVVSAQVVDPAALALDPQIYTYAQTEIKSDIDGTVSFYFPDEKEILSAHTHDGTLTLVNGVVMAKIDDGKSLMRIYCNTAIGQIAIRVIRS